MEGERLLGCDSKPCRDLLDNDSIKKTSKFKEISLKDDDIVLKEVEFKIVIVTRI